MPKLNIWSYDHLNPDDYKEVRAFPLEDYVYCGIEYDSHSEVSYFYNDTNDHHVPIVIFEQLSAEIVKSHMKVLSESPRNRIIVMVPNNYPEMLAAIQELGYEINPAA